MRNGNCLVALLALMIIIWLIFMGGCQLICKKTADGLKDDPVPTAPVGFSLLQHASLHWLSGKAIVRIVGLIKGC